jgi:hypothetical protein
MHQLKPGLKQDRLASQQIVPLSQSVNAKKGTFGKKKHAISAQHATFSPT